MKLKFKKQQYQEDAAISVVKCFEGQTKGDRRELIKRNIKKGIAYQESFEEDILAFANKKIDVMKFVDDIVPLEGVQDAYIRLTSGTDSAIKILVDPNK